MGFDGQWIVTSASVKSVTCPLIRPRKTFIVRIFNHQAEPILQRHKPVQSKARYGRGLRGFGHREVRALNVGGTLPRSDAHVLLVFLCHPRHGRPAARNAWPTVRGTPK